MAKRFSDTEKWKDAWFRKLEPKNKLFWFYILDNCDHAGIWKVDIELAGLFCGFEFDEKELLEVFKGRIRVISSDKWFASKFVLFQHSVQSLEELSISNKVHLSAIKILQANGLVTKDMTVFRNSSPIQGAKEKNTYKSISKVMDMEIEKGKTKNEATVSPYLDNPPDVDEVARYMEQQGVEDELIFQEANCFLAHNDMNEWKRKSGEPINDWTKAAALWVANMPRFQ